MFLVWVKEYVWVTGRWWFRYYINPITPTWNSQRQLSPIYLRRHDVGHVKSGTSSPKTFQRIFGIIRQRSTWQRDSVCMISRYGSIAPGRWNPATTPKFSALSGGLDVRGFYIIMRAWRERGNVSANLNSNYFLIVQQSNPKFWVKHALESA